MLTWGAGRVLAGSAGVSNGWIEGLLSKDKCNGFEIPLPLRASRETAGTRAVTARLTRTLALHPNPNPNRTPTLPLALP